MELSFQEAAQYLGVTEKTLQTYSTSGKIRALTKDALDAYIAKRRKAHLLEGRDREIAALLAHPYISLREIGRRLNVSGDAVRQKVIRMGYNPEKLRKRGLRIKKRKTQVSQNRSQTAHT